MVLSLRNDTLADDRVASATIDRDAKALRLRLLASMESYELSYQEVMDGREGEWRVLGNVDTSQMTARDFTGTIFGVFAHHSGGAEEAAQWVTFSSYAVDP